ncbi:hypothetical protein ARMGADRAFT_1016085, partial [Armillaria gallica]
MIHWSKKSCMSCQICTSMAASGCAMEWSSSRSSEMIRVTSTVRGSKIFTTNAVDFILSIFLPTTSAAQSPDYKDRIFPPEDDKHRILVCCGRHDILVVPDSDESWSGGSQRGMLTLPRDGGSIGEHFTVPPNSSDVDALGARFCTESSIVVRRASPTVGTKGRGKEDVHGHVRNAQLKYRSILRAHFQPSSSSLSLMLKSLATSTSVCRNLFFTGLVGGRIEGDRVNGGDGDKDASSGVYEHRVILLKRQFACASTMTQQTAGGDEDGIEKVACSRLLGTMQGQLEVRWKEAFKF